MKGTFVLLLLALLVLGGSPTPSKSQSTIGAASPGYKLDVNGNARINGQLSVNTPPSMEFVSRTMTVRSRPADWIAFSVHGTNRSAFNDDEIFYVFVEDDPTVGIRGELFVDGNAFKTAGGATWQTPSDRRLKQDVRAYECGLKEVLRLRPVRFRYKDDPEMGLTSDHEEVGFIAQEVHELIPGAVAEGKNGYLTLKADPIQWAAINAIRELNAKLEDKDARIAALEQRLAKLEQLLEEANKGTAVPDSKNPAQ